MKKCIRCNTNKSIDKFYLKKKTISKKLGVSDRAIAKRCTKLGIKQPPRGYWTGKY